MSHGGHMTNMSMTNMTMHNMTMHNMTMHNMTMNGTHLPHDVSHLLPNGGCHDHSTHDHGTHGGHSMGAHTLPNGCVMNMLFHASVTECVIFEGWNIKNHSQFVASWIGIFFMVFLRELIVLIQRWPRLLRYIAACFGAEQQSGTHKSLDVVEGSSADWALTLWDAFWYAINVALGYVIMLIFMTFNIGLCSAVVVGFFCSRVFLQRKVGYLTRLKNKQRGDVEQRGTSLMEMEKDGGDCCNVPDAATEADYTPASPPANEEEVEARRKRVMSNESIASER